MVNEKRLVASIDQSANMLDFPAGAGGSSSSSAPSASSSSNISVTDPQAAALLAWDASIKTVCSEINETCDLVTKFMEVS
jgi:hypothetical protein